MSAAKKSSTPKPATSKRKGAGKGRPAPDPARQAGRARARRDRSAPARRRRPAPSGHAGMRRRADRIPAILREGDRPGAPSPLAQRDPAKPARGGTEPGVEGGVLPEAYGTRRLRLTPRDPHWIHARWDFTRPQLRAVAADAPGGGLYLRLHRGTGAGVLVSETRVDPSSTRWLVHAPEAARFYTAELGFYAPQKQWTALARSEPVRTPPAGLSPDRRFETATLTSRGNLRRHGDFPKLTPPAEDLRPAPLPQSAPARGSSMDVRGAPAAPSSFGIAQWNSGAFIVGVSSSWPGRPERPFRLEVNAELIVYGATEPDATLRLGDRSVQLQADGSFRLRFALPDGAHSIPLTAVAADGRAVREARLRFGRQTVSEDRVESATPDPDLAPPGTENL